MNDELVGDGISGDHRVMDEHALGRLACKVDVEVGAHVAALNPAHEEIGRAASIWPQ